MANLMKFIQITHALAKKMQRAARDFPGRPATMGERGSSHEAHALAKGLLVERQQVVVTLRQSLLEAA